MMSIGQSIPTLGITYALIDQYAGVIAADYAHTFLEPLLSNTAETGCAEH